MKEKYQRKGEREKGTIEKGRTIKRERERVSKETGDKSLESDSKFDFKNSLKMIMRHVQIDQSYKLDN